MAMTTVRVQEKGQVTIPLQIRKRLKLKKGDLVAFVETNAGVLITPAEVVVTQAAEAISRSLKEKGVTLEQLIERGREIRGDLLKEAYGLTDTSET